MKKQELILEMKKLVKSWKLQQSLSPAYEQLDALISMADSIPAHEAMLYESMRNLYKLPPLQTQFVAKGTAYETCGWNHKASKNMLRIKRISDGAPFHCHPRYCTDAIEKAKSLKKVVKDA